MSVNDPQVVMSQPIEKLLNLDQLANVIKRVKPLVVPQLITGSEGLIYISKFRTIGEICACYGPYWLGFNPEPIDDIVFTEMLRFGLTRFDFAFLPKESMPLYILQSISKKNWYKKPAFLLGPQFEEFLLDLGRRTGYRGSKHAARISVRQLLRLCGANTRTGHLGRELLQKHGGTIREMRALLRTLGFTNRDGVFMRFGS